MNGREAQDAQIEGQSGFKSGYFQKLKNCQQTH